MDLGLVGLPRSGKSALLSLLTGGAAPGRLAVARVPDVRLDALAELYRPRRVTAATMQLIELPGLLPGRLDKGERNAFFEGVRKTDALLHVVRAWDDPASPHPLGTLDPLRDARDVEDELLLADLERAEGLATRLQRNRTRSREEELQIAALQRCAAGLGEARPIRLLGLAPEELELLGGFGLLTARGEILALNVSEEDLRAGRTFPHLQAWAAAAGIPVVVFSARVEAEIAALPPEMRGEFLAAYDLHEPGTDRLARAAYAALGLISFLTAGEDEVRAWPIPAGTVARRAAGKIHSDIERGFIRAEVAAFEALQSAGSWKALREKGLLRVEGRDYVVRDGDVIEFRFNV